MGTDWQKEKEVFFKYIIEDEWKAFKLGNKLLRRIRKNNPDTLEQERALEFVQRELWTLMLEKYPWIADFDEVDCSVNPKDLGWGLFCYLEEMTGLSKRYHLCRMGKDTGTIVCAMASHICETHTVSAAAEELGMDRHELSRALKKKIGVSASEYRNMLKIERAIHLMRKGSENVPEISGKLGYASVDHFRKVFQEQTGCRPEQYQNG